MRGGAFEVAQVRKRSRRREEERMTIVTYMIGHALAVKKPLDVGRRIAAGDFAVCAQVQVEFERLVIIMTMTMIMGEQMMVSAWIWGREALQSLAWISS